MSTVVLVSGGLDSTLVACLGSEVGVQQFPLFVDYGQRARDRELAACIASMQALKLPAPKIASLGGFGSLIQSGLTNREMMLVEEAFTPGRNMLFLLVGAAYAAQVGADSVSIGLLHEDVSLFPDQTKAFANSAEATLAMAVGKPIKVLLPLAEFHKRDVVALAEAKGIANTYSCHAGEQAPCGICIACREFDFEARS